MIYWTYLLIAAVFEVAWMFCLRYMSFASLKSISFRSTGWQDMALIIVPFVGYVVFGLGNIYCFSVATKHIPVSVAFAVWMGVALCGVKLIEIIFYKQTGTLLEYLFITMILVAIIGLKMGKT